MRRLRSHTLPSRLTQTAKRVALLPHAHSLCDKIDIEDLGEDENQLFVKFFKYYRCYDLIPVSAKLVVFDTELLVKKAFFALVSNGVRAAPLWDSAKQEFIGMLTITDFIYILRNYYKSPLNLAAEKTYNNLDITIKKALEHRDQVHTILMCRCV
ncbi:AMP-activated protein kinase, gamma regulatory subunit, putative [Ixodes scapularis]|uniref:AMP-activated protein kinase, gamma regulatory subunit, putative n=1 Tax=Ixodes scapularis TaxID=6945 RepID=B7Q3C0_IXOSC|nr:AMP-activated protein kinase, gamma regulatory subunit, putative [Ixodes scapularis]|eukprot:XP_002411218.1 AMP-activated protein kinase, gamma regulatory subunit, putative [Ixodes scapularis]